MMHCRRGMGVVLELTLNELYQEQQRPVQLQNGYTVVALLLTCAQTVLPGCFAPKFQSCIQSVNVRLCMLALILTSSRQDISPGTSQNHISFFQSQLSLVLHFLCFSQYQQPVLNLQYHHGELLTFAPCAMFLSPGQTTLPFK